MPAFSITRHIAAPVETVWAVLDDFGDIQRWNPGVATSALTSSGPVSEGTTRRCDFAPNGDGTELTLSYSYTLNRLGRLAKGTTDKQLRKGLGGLVDGLQQESERMAIDV